MAYIDSRKADPVWAIDLAKGDLIRFNGGREHVITEVGYDGEQDLVNVTIKDVEDPQALGDIPLQFAPDTEVWKVVR